MLQTVLLADRRIQHLQKVSLRGIDVDWTAGPEVCFDQHHKICKARRFGGIPSAVVQIKTVELGEARLLIMKETKF